MFKSVPNALITSISYGLYHSRTHKEHKNHRQTIFAVNCIYILYVAYRKKTTDIEKKLEVLRASCGTKVREA